MVREIERVAGIPIVQIATIVPIMLTVGANRIVPGIAIPHPLGKPGDAEEDHAVRRGLLLRALKAIATPIESQTIFKE
jgi:betaine reductase